MDPLAVVEGLLSTETLNYPMKSPTYIFGPAEIPLLGWSGPSFLLFYGLALIGTGFWSWLRIRRLPKEHEVPGDSTVLADPYEVAYLSAGGKRVAQMAVSRLILMELAVWKSKFSGPRLIRVEGAVPGLLNADEQRLWAMLEQAGHKGVAVKAINKALGEHLAPLQTRLAVLGLRPTDGERRTATWKAVRPMLLLVIMGVLKLLVGLTGDKPVLFLAALLVLTVFVIYAMINSAARLTPAGQSLLDRLRGIAPPRAGLGQGASCRDAGHLDSCSMSLALYGPDALSGLPGFSRISQEMKREMDAPAAMDQGGGSGCSSGCSSGSSGVDGGSGCGGGGGCGGCGS